MSCAVRYIKKPVKGMDPEDRWEEQKEFMDENLLFEKAPVPKAFFTLTIPLVLGRIVGLVYNMVDTYFIAKTQDAALVAGVSLCAPVFILMVALGDLFGLGSSSVISRLFGERKDEEGRNVSSFGFWGSVAVGVLTGLLMLLFQTPVLHLLGAEGEVFSHAAQYYKYIALGAPAMVVSLVPTNQLRTEGLANQCMAASVAGSVLNMILDPIFIFTLRMGAAGAAIATVLGNVLSVAIMIWVTAKKARKLSVSPRHAHVSRENLLAVFAIGIPASLNNVMQSFAGVLLNRNLVSYGTDSVAAMGIASKVYMVLMMIMVSFAFGAMPLIGFCYGADNRERLKKTIRFDILVQLVIAVAVAGTMALTAPRLMQFFLKDSSVVEKGSLMLRCMLASAPFAGLFLVFITLFQATGKAMPTLVLTLSRQGILYAVCIFALRALFGFHGVICAQAVSDVLTTLLAVLLLRSSGIEL